MAWAALVLGLAGSLHCAGMCGPLALALPHPGRGMGGFVAGRLLYQAGRLLTYMLMGLASGALGHGLSMVGVQRWVSLTAGLLLLSGLVATAWARPAAWMGRWTLRIKGWLGWSLRRRTMGSLLVLGLVNGLLPCGLVYAAAALAATAGGVWAGMGSMALFGLGTIPVMLGLGLGGRAFPASWRLRLSSMLPASLAAVGLLLVLRGMALGIPYLSPDMAGGSCCHPR
ncbi:MAG: sulfite exporter TauE/SafE family protein [Verrucomicrobiota bacterium]